MEWMHKEKSAPHFHMMLIELPGSSLSKSVTANPFLIKNNPQQIPCIPAPIIPILKFLSIYIHYKD